MIINIIYNNRDILEFILILSILSFFICFLYTAILLPIVHELGHVLIIILTSFWIQKPRPALPKLKWKPSDRLCKIAGFTYSDTYYEIQNRHIFIQINSLAGLCAEIFTHLIVFVFLYSSNYNLTEEQTILVKLAIIIIITAFLIRLIKFWDSRDL